MAAIHPDHSDIIRDKTDSFYGSRSVILPAKLIKSVRNAIPSCSLYISDIGFYPAARHHRRDRKKGIDEHILIYCVDGSGTLEIKNRSFEIGPDSWFVIPANVPHTYYAGAKNPWSIYWLHFGGPHSQNYYHLFGKITRLCHSTRHRSNDRITLFNEILTVLESGLSPENIEFSNLYLHSLLASLFYSQTYCSAKGYQSKNPVDESIKYMQMHINEHLKIKTLADYVQMSESHFSKVFKNKTGSSPMEYFIGLKMQEATRMLVHLSMRVKETAFALGYDDPLYFSRVFSRHMGESPATFARFRNNES